MKAAALITLLLLAVTLFGCSGIEVNTDYDTNFDFSQLRTYDWISQQAPVFRDRRVDTTLFQKRLQSSVEAEMAAKGFTKHTGSGEPDFQIAYYVGTEDRVDVTTYGYHYPRGPYWWGGDIDVYHYRQGTLILDFVEPEKDELIWRGIATKVIDEGASPEKVQRNVDEVVKKILGRFPPK
jgi:hypothetical protein